MHRVDTPGATQDNKFTDGDPAISAPATVVDAAILNALQEEIVYCIAQMNIALEKGNNTQLWAAINTLLALGIAAHESHVHTYFSARRTTALTLSRAVVTNPLCQEEIDPGNCYNPATGRYTVTEAGYYVFCAEMETAVTRDTTFGGAEVLKNGQIIAWSRGENPPLNGLNGSVNALAVSRPIYMAEGDYVEARYYYDDWYGSPPATLALQISQYANFFGGWRVL